MASHRGKTARRYCAHKSSVALFITYLPVQNSEYWLGKHSDNQAFFQELLTEAEVRGLASPPHSSTSTPSF